MNSDKANWRSVFKVLFFAKRYWPLIGLSLLAMALFASSEAAYLVLMRKFLDAFMKGLRSAQQIELSVPELRRVGKIALLLAPAVAFFAFAQDYLRGTLVWRLVTELRDSICAALMPQSLSFFEDRRSGDLMSRITNDVSRSQAVFTQLFGGIPESGCQMIMGIAVAAWASWQLLALSIVAIPLVVLPVAYLARRIRRYGRQGLEKLSDLTDLMSQMFSGIRVIKAFKMEDAETQEFQRTNRSFLRKVMKMVVAHGLSAGSIELVIRVIIGCGILLGAWLVSREGSGLDIGRLAVFVGGNYYAFNATRKLVKAYNQLQESMPASDRILELIEAKPSLQDAPDAITLRRVEKGIRFQDVTFGYAGEHVLRNVSFEVKRGETVAVVGRSGAGKSTLVALIPRFYEVTSGAVLIDGTDVRGISRDSLLDQFAIVTQQTFLFNRSIADNIRYGRRDATQEEVEQAARAANIHDYILSQPEGYQALCGEYGTKLSGGQRQRIAIARALLKNADILILDEAMVGLDAESESLVREALTNLMKGRTTFVITHDLQTIQTADRILVLRDGRLVGDGNHEQLMAQDGEYRALCAMQFAMLSGPGEGEPRRLSEY